MTGRPKKMQGRTYAITLDDTLIAWIDEIRKTPFGELSRPEVIRSLIKQAMEKHKNEIH